MSALDLCRQWGMSERMYNEFLRPTLLVGLFAPPEDISAAVMLETLYFYALGHQNKWVGAGVVGVGVGEGEGGRLPGLRSWLKVVRGRWRMGAGAWAGACAGDAMG